MKKTVTELENRLFELMSGDFDPSYQDLIDFSEDCVNNPKEVLKTRFPEEFCDLAGIDFEVIKALAI